MEDFKIAIILDPKNALAFFNLGLAYFMKKDLKRLIENYNQAVSLSPKLLWTEKTRPTLN